MPEALCGCNSWDAMLNMTKVSDADIYFFFEKRMRRGVSYISKRYSKPKNKYLKSCDAKQESYYEFRYE